MGSSANERYGAPYVAGKARPRTRDWRTAMSDNVATALLVYTALQIFFTMKALASALEYSVVPYLGLVVLVAVVIPFLRYFEKRWIQLPDEIAGDPSYAGQFRRDQLLLWTLTIAFPLLLTLTLKWLIGEG